MNSYIADEVIYLPEAYLDEALPGLVETSESNPTRDFRRRNRRREISELVGTETELESDPEEGNTSDKHPKKELNRKAVKTYNPGPLTSLCRIKIFEMFPELRILTDKEKVAVLSPPLPPNVIKKHLNCNEIEVEPQMYLPMNRPMESNSVLSADRFLRAFTEALEVMERLENLET